MKRRDFLKNSASAAVTGVALAQTAAGLEPALADNRNGLGLQLWTVRNQLASDAAATLKSVQDAGYKQVELMSVVDSEEIVRIANDLGLEIRSAFFNWETIANPSNREAPKLETVIEVANDIGLEHLVFGYIGKTARDTADKMKKIADATNAAADKVKRAGMQLSYHNHSFEFEKLTEDQTGFDFFIQRFDPELVKFELDVFWVAIGGWDPIATIRRLGTRLGQIHLKDLKADMPVIYDEAKVPEDAFQEVGDGTISMHEVIQLATEFGVRQFHVEQDQSPDPLASIRQSQAFTSTIW